MEFQEITEAVILQVKKQFDNTFVDEIIHQCRFVSIPPHTEILKEGQYVKVVPFVMDGLIKVFNRYQDKELLLYYIQPNESCVMSYSASLRNDPSKVFAITEEKTTAVLFPADKIGRWTRDFPDLNKVFFQQYNKRYSDLLDTIHHIIFDKMDKRLLDYLEEKVRLTGKNPVKISHRQIASELGTAREVVSRVIKKLEHDTQLLQHSNSIEILKL